MCEGIQKWSLVQPLSYTKLNVHEECIEYLKERGREARRQGGREGGREARRKGGREAGREEGREGGRHRGKEGERGKRREKGVRILRTTKVKSRKKI